MEMIWFGIVSVMAALWVVLDGFDLGAGALHLVVAREERERRSVLAAIGPFWDGNEVWLLALGGALFLAFPAVLATAFAGLYMAVFLITWCLVVRGLSLEVRSHVAGREWRAFFDVLFSVSSMLLPLLFGVALGNVLRGFPIDASGQFSLGLFGDFDARGASGVLDWYTVLVGAMALVSLAHHGALWLAHKAAEPVRARAARFAGRAWIAAALLWLACGIATQHLRPELMATAWSRPLSLTLGLVAIASFGASFLLARRGRAGLAFLTSAGFLVALLAATAAAAWPTMLHSTLSASWSLTAINSATPAEGLRTGLVWWSLAFPIALAWLFLLLRLHRGTIQPAADGEGY
ncbi:MAG: cytochrome d ubiquinol oxidase subunit II [Planctomycetia bacterium]